MNSYPAYTDFFNEVSSKLELLGQEPGMINVFFVASPEIAETLISAIRTNLTLPCVLVEFYDEDKSEKGGKFSDLTGAFVVLQEVDKKNEGNDHVRTVIYEQAKPAADQILAYMLKKGDSGEMKANGHPIFVSSEARGIWIGPLHSNLYGWRYEFTWRIAAASCFNPGHWKP